MHKLSTLRAHTCVKPYTHSVHTCLNKNMYIRWVTFGSAYTSALLGEYLLDDTGAFYKNMLPSFLIPMLGFFKILDYYYRISGYCYSNSLIFPSLSLHHQNFMYYWWCKETLDFHVITQFFSNLMFIGRFCISHFLIEEKIFREVDGGCGHWFI